VFGEGSVNAIGLTMERWLTKDGWLSNFGIPGNDGIADNHINRHKSTWKISGINDRDSEPFMMGREDRWAPVPGNEHFHDREVD